MAEANQCDRCGDLYPGPPDKRLMIGDGEPRYTRAERRDREIMVEGELRFETDLDICSECYRGLLSWWEVGGGDISDIAFDLEEEKMGEPQ